MVFGGVFGLCKTCDHIPDLLSNVAQISHLQGEPQGFNRIVFWDFSCWQSRLRYRACQWRRDRFECRLKEYTVPLGGNGGCGTLILFLEAHILLISHARLVSGVSKQSSEIVHGAHLESLQ